MTPELQNFVNGARTDARGTESISLIDPATEDVYATAPVSTADDVADAYRAAQTAFHEWGSTTPAERQLALFRIADAMEERAEEFADAESLDTGKPRASLVEDEILLSVDQIRFFAGAARNLEGRSAGEYLTDHTSFIRREPIGVVGQVTPWNYPLNMAVWKFAPALAAGNTTVLKPSDTTPLSTLLLAEVASEFLPAGVLNVVLGDRITGAAMIDHPTPQLVSITGSVRAGMEVARAASSDLKRVHLELGGKAPVIVFDDADIEKAVEGMAPRCLVSRSSDSRWTLTERPDERTPRQRRCRGPPRAQAHPWKGNTMTTTNYVEALKKFSTAQKAAVNFKDDNWTNSAITRERVKRLNQARAELLATIPDKPTEVDTSARGGVLEGLLPTNADSAAITASEWGKVEKLLGAGRNFVRIIEQADKRRLAAIIDQLPTHLDAQGDHSDKETAGIVAEVQDRVFQRLVELGDEDAAKVLQGESGTRRQAAWERVVRETINGDVSIEAWSDLNRVAPDERAIAQDEDAGEAADIADKVRSLDHIASNINTEATVGAE